MLDACVALECRPDVLAAARQFVRTSLREWEFERLTDDAVLATSELVANAVLHSGTDIRLRVLSDGLSMVRVEVSDGNTRMPSPAARPQDATSGRGLNIVAALGTAWGTALRRDGKIVWVELGERSTDSETDEDCADLADAVNIDDALGLHGRRSQSDNADA